MGASHRATAKFTGIVLTLLAVSSSGAAQQPDPANRGQPEMEKPNPPVRKETVRDRLWLWGHHAGAQKRQYGLQQDSTITPAAAAKAMGIIRKNSLCNRSEHGASVQAILTSVYRTLKLRGLDPLETIVAALKDYVCTGSLPPLPGSNTSDG